MRVRKAVLAVSAVSMLTSGATMAAERSSPAIFRISVNGSSMDVALRDATMVISQRCAASGFVIVNNQIRQSPDGSFYYGPVTARCMA